MSKRLQNQLFIAIATLLAVVFIYILFSKIDKEKTLLALQSANYFWILISVFLGIFAYWLRAKRWNILFEPMGFQVKDASAFWTIAFGYFMNLTIPRSGEVARATSLYSIEKVPVEKSLGTVLLERLVDLVYLIILIFLTLTFCPEPFEIFRNFSQGSSSLTWLYAFMALIIPFVALVWVFRKRIMKWKGYEKIRKIFLGFKEGLLSILKIKHKFLFFLYSTGIWVCYFLMTFLVIYAFPETQNIPWNYGFFLMTAGTFGMLIPATGGLAYPLLMRYAFGAIFLSLGESLESGYEAGSNYGIVLYLAQTFSVIIFGFLSMIYIARNKTSKKISA